MTWYTGPSTQLAQLGDLLLQRGYSMEASPGMGVDLATLADHLPAMPGLVIQPVRSETDFHAWSQTFHYGNEIPAELNEAFTACYAAIGYGPSAPVTHYLARLNGEAVAISSLVIGAGVVGIYTVGTLPAARRQEIGTAVTLAALLDARAQGYRAGVLFASEMGASVYRRLGFKEVCKIVAYDNLS
jgi:ribosomal protein S18 acetylase RimI-like enzyme